MSTENILIKQYNEKNASEYKEILKTYYVPSEFWTLSRQRLENEKTVFLMFIESEKKVFLFKYRKVELIGYCIVENVNVLPKEWEGYWQGIYGVPDAVLKENPTVISDFMILRIKRRQGYGKKLADYILNEVYCDKRMSLSAVEDGVHFWHKLGFEYVTRADSTMIIKGGKRNA